MRIFGLKALCLGTLILILAGVQSHPADRLPALRPQEGSGDQAPLQKILQSVGQYCEKVKGVALFYVCKEKIIDKEYLFEDVTGASGLLREERIFQVRRINRRTYSYDYQLIKKGDDLSEERTLLEENGKKKNMKNADLKHIKYSSQYPVYGPVGFFSFYWQNHFDYSIIGDDRVDNQPAVVILATPKEEREDNCQIGRIWVGRDFQILRLELEPASLKTYEDETIVSRLGEFHKKVVWTIDYTIEKNGVRFPGRQLIRELFVHDTADSFQQKAMKRETLFEYVAYKFFTVETDVKF